MRLDVFLHAVCLVKSRSLAKEACVRGRVLVNNTAAKGSRSVSPGDHIRLDLGFRILEMDVVEVPSGKVSRKAAEDYYHLLSNKTVDDMERADS